MAARVTFTSASVGSTRRASGTFSTRTSPAAYMTVACTSAPDRRRRCVLVVRDVLAPDRGVALVVHVEHREVDHEPVRRGPVPVILLRLEEDTVTGADDLDRPAAALR